jgi:nitrate reductase NapE component
MESTTGENWKLRRFVPRELRRLSFLAVAFYTVLAVGLAAALIGVAWMVRQAQAPPPNGMAPGPYIFLLVACGVSLTFAALVWSAAGLANVHPIPGGGDNVTELEPPHRQKWTYQESRDHRYTFALFAIAWHLIGVSVLLHYYWFAGLHWGGEVVVFALYELIGFVPCCVGRRASR